MYSSVFKIRLSRDQIQNVTNRFLMMKLWSTPILQSFKYWSQTILQIKKQNHMTKMRCHTLEKESFGLELILEILNGTQHRQTSTFRFLWPYLTPIFVQTYEFLQFCALINWNIFMYVVFDGSCKFDSVGKAKEINFCVPLSLKY